MIVAQNDEGMHTMVVIEGRQNLLLIVKLYGLKYGGHSWTINKLRGLVGHQAGWSERLCYQAFCLVACAGGSGLLSRLCW